MDKIIEQRLSSDFSNVRLLPLVLIWSQLSCGVSSTAAIAIAYSDGGNGLVPTVDCRRSSRCSPTAAVGQEIRIDRIHVPGIFEPVTPCDLLVTT